MLDICWTYQLETDILFFYCLELLAWLKIPKVITMHNAPKKLSHIIETFNYKLLIFPKDMCTYRVNKLMIKLCSTTLTHWVITGKTVWLWLSSSPSDNGNYDECKNKMQLFFKFLIILCMSVYRRALMPKLEVYFMVLIDVDNWKKGWQGSRDNKKRWLDLDVHKFKSTSISKNWMEHFYKGVNIYHYYPCTQT